jgi:hypothetical protein
MSEAKKGSVKNETKVQIPDYHTIKVGNESREIFMSYALLNLLAGYVVNLERLVTLHTDPYMHERLVTILLAPRDEKGRPQLEKEEDGDLVPFDLFSTNISRKEVDALMAWVEAHLLDFFMKGMEAMMNNVATQAPLLQKINQKTKDLELSIPGISDLISQKLAAGL